jgi:hypothetical protein
VRLDIAGPDISGITLARFTRLLFTTPLSYWRAACALPGTHCGWTLPFFCARQHRFITALLEKNAYLPRLRCLVAFFTWHSPRLTTTVARALLYAAHRLLRPGRCLRWISGLVVPHVTSFGLPLMPPRYCCAFVNRWRMADLGVRATTRSATSSSGRAFTVPRLPYRATHLAVAVCFRCYYLVPSGSFTHIRWLAPLPVPLPLFTRMLRCTLTHCSACSRTAAVCVASSDSSHLATCLPPLHAAFSCAA